MPDVTTFFDGQARSVLFTTEPNQSVAPVHNRMPLILKKTQIAAWLSDFNAASEMIANPMPELFSKKV
ncbi:MAG: SOS response-associated peptidase family protein [Oenococcus sp.]